MYDEPALVSLGSIFCSSEPLDLTEPETEYVVKVVKHIVSTDDSDSTSLDLVLQFSILNTVSDQALKDVVVELDLLDSDCPWQVKHSIVCPVIRYSETKCAYVWLEQKTDEALDFSSVEAKTELKFRVVEVNPEDDIEGTLLTKCFSRCMDDEFT